MKLQTRSPLLKFSKAKNNLRDSLSAVVFIGDNLWVASDESTSVERLKTDDGLTFTNHKSFALDNLIPLPAQGTQFDQEIDIEGLDFSDSYLWLVGSHSIKRKKIDGGDTESGAKLMRKLAKTELDGNRFILARIPLIENDNDQKLVASTVDPAIASRILQASSLSGDTGSDALTHALRNAEDGKGDIHLARFMDIPGKDNGFDIEGLAVVSERIFVGLRGPVLRGWALILELSLKTGDHPQLELEEFESIGRPYRKHFLDLGGLGVRDLCVNGEDLIVLAGPTMSLDGPTKIFRWRDALNSSEETVVRGDRLVHEVDVPSGSGTDHAEGIAIIPNEQKPLQILVVYDSPSIGRKEGSAGVRADVFDLPN